MDNKKASSNKLVGIIGILTSIILIFFYSRIISSISTIVEGMTPDKYLEPNKVLIIKILFIIFVIIILLLSSLSLLNVKLKPKHYLDKIIDTSNVSNFFFKDKLCTKKQLPFFVFFIGSIISILLHISFLIYGKPEHEGVLERFSTPLFLFAGIILLISITQLKNSLLNSNAKKKALILLITISLALIFVYGEEVSWGQQFFGWESSDAFKDLNFQGETNLHNFFNPLFIFAYPIAGVGFFILLFLTWLFPNKNYTYLSKLFLPHPSLFYLVFIMASATFGRLNEIFEALLALCAFLYSIRIFMCLRFPKPQS